MTPDVIIANLQARVGEDAVRELHAELSGNEAIVDSAGFLHDIEVRLAFGSTCLSREVAIPHARTHRVSRPVLAIGRSTHGVAFDADHPEIRLIFLIGVPLTAVTEYLSLVAKLARALRDPKIRGSWLEASSPEAIRALWDSVMSNRRLVS